MLRRNVKLINYINYNSNKKVGKGVKRCFTYPLNQVSVSCRYKATEKKDEVKKECPPDGSGRGFYYTLGGIIIGTGAFVLYAKYDDDFRQWLKDNAPTADRFVAIVSAEEKGYTETLNDAFKSLYNKISSFSPSETTETKKPASGEISSPKEPAKPEKKPSPVAPSSSPPAIKAPPKETPKPIEPVKKDKDKVEVKKDIKKESGKIDDKQKEIKEKAGSFDVTGVQQALTNLLTKSINLKEQIEQSYKEIITIYKEMGEFYQKVVDGSIEHADPSVMDKIKELRTDRTEDLKNAEEIYKTALTLLEDYKTELKAQDRIVARSTHLTEEQKEAIDGIREEILSMFKKLEDTKKNFEREKARLSLTEKYWKQVQDARKHFGEELEMLFPNVRIQDKNMKLADEELDLFILYAFQNILFYQKELARLDSLYKANVEKAFTKEMQEKDVVRAIIEKEMEQERRKIGAEFQKRILCVRAECEKDMRQTMKRQAEAHVNHINELIELKEKQSEVQMQRTVDEKIAELRQDHQVQLADIIGRMRALDSIICKKIKADAKSSKSQELWAACEALQEALLSSDPSEGLYRQFRPLEGIVEAIYMAAAPGDEFVDAILSSLPVEARKRGVFTTTMLKDRFLTVRRVCKKVALLPEGGAPLPVMFLSWLQSKLIIDSDEIPIEELTNKEFDPSKLNTFQILDRASYWIERHDYKQALRYMNLLDGAPKAVAGDWIRETQIFLEVSQAARALMAYSVASSSAYS